MRESKLFIALSALSRRNLDKFHTFLTSSYFNSKPEVIRLFQYYQHFQEIPEAFDDRRSVYRKVFKKEEYDDKQMRYTISNLYQQLKLFLALREWQDDELDVQLQVLRALRKMKVSKQFEQQVNKTRTTLKLRPFRNQYYHFQHYQLLQEEYEYVHRQRRRGDMKLQELTNELTIFFVASILKQGCNMLTHQNINRAEYTIHFLDYALDAVDSGLFIEHPSVAIYYHSYKALTDTRNNDHFYALKALIERNWQYFPPDEIRDIYLTAINYCIKRSNQGFADFIQEGYQLYRSGFENKSLIVNNTISRFTYKNAAMLGMALGENQWVEHFLHTHKKYLPLEHRENSYMYNLAIYYYRVQDYDKAMDLLQKVEFKDVFNNLDARRMLLRIYYELGEYMALDSHLDSFKSYLQRQRDIGYHRKNYMNLIRFVRKALRLEPGNMKDLQALIREIDQAAAFPEKNWLKAQLMPRVPSKSKS